MLHFANFDPVGYGVIDARPEDVLKKIDQVELALPKKVANWLYLNPVKMMGEPEGVTSKKHVDAAVHGKRGVDLSLLVEAFASCFAQRKK